MKKVFKDSIKSLRETRGMSQTDLDRKAGLYNSAISHIETWEYKPKEDVIKKIAKALDVDISQIYGHDGKTNRVEMLRLKLSEVEERLNVLYKVVDSMNDFFERIDEKMLYDDEEVEQLADKYLIKVMRLLKG